MKSKILSLIIILGTMAFVTNANATYTPPASCVPPTNPVQCAEDILTGFLQNTLCTNSTITKNADCAAMCKALPSLPTGNQLACCLQEAGGGSMGSIALALAPVCLAASNISQVCTNSTGQLIIGYLCCPLDSLETASSCLPTGGCSNYVPQCPSSSGDLSTAKRL